MKEPIIGNIPSEILKYYQKMEEEYKQHLQIYQSLFYQNPEAVFSVDLEGNFTSANEIMTTKGECDLATILQFKFRDFVHPDYLEESERRFAEMIKGVVQDYKTKVISAKGTAMDIAIKCLPIYVNGAIIGGYGIATDITNETKHDLEIKNVLENLAKAYVEKDNILESITEGFFAIDAKWNFVYCNRVVEKIWGIEKQHIVGKNFWDLIDMGNAPDILVEFKKAMDQKVRVQFEMYYPPFNMWLDITAYPNDNGVSSIVKVINEEKRTESLFNLEKEALELSAQLGATADDIVSYLIDGIQEIHPDMICCLLHVRNGELFNWYAPNLPEDYKAMIDHFPIGLNHGSCGTAAFTKTAVIVPDIANSSIWGEYKEIAASFGFKACWSLPLLDKDKEVFGTFGIYYKSVKPPTTAEMNSVEKIRNLLATIILNKKAEEEILISKERYDIVAMATNDAIWDCDLISRSVVWNNGINSIFGYKPEEVVNTIEWGWSKIHPEDKGRAIENLMSNLEGDSNTFRDEFRCTCADGTYKYVQNKVFIISDAKTKKAIRLIGALQDVSEQKKTELQLRELNETLKERADQLATSNTELERFAYIASHDLQEPLRTITSFLQLFKRKYAGKIDETADNYITFAVDGADRMKQLIMDMLEYSRVNTQLKLTEEVDIKQVIDEVLFNFSGKIKLTDAIIKVDENMPKVFAVKTQMMQVFQNLISNAFKYQKPNKPPQISMGTKELETEWQFSVKDDGIGIEAKFFEKIFIIFQRLHSKTQFSGTGIGLAICKKIIEKHNGRIWVESEPEVGSTFFFTIPKK